MRVRCTLAFFMALAACTPAARADSVKVRVEGVGGDARRNVLTMLSIARLEKRDDLTETGIRQADSKAASEIDTALQPFGYYKSEVRSDLQRDGTKWTATYTIAPGPPLHVNGLDVKLIGPGADDPGFRERVDGFPLAKGATLDQTAYERGKQSFVDYAAANGYLDGDFREAQIRIDRDLYTADVVLHFATGPQFLFGPVRMHQDILDPDVLRGYVNFKQGQPLDTQKLLGLQNALSGSPYFSRVEVVTKREEAQGLEVPVDVDLVPAARQHWQFGLGYGTDTGPRGRVDYELRRINRRGHRAEGSVVASGIEKTLETRYVVPGPYPRTDTLTYSIGYADVRPTTSVQQTGLVGVRQTRSIGRWRQAIGLAFQRERYEVGLDRGTKEMVLPQASWQRTYADDRIYPLHGGKVEFRVRGAHRGFLTDVTFAELYTTGKYIYALGDSGVRLIGRVELGYDHTSMFRELPASIRFFAGGDQSVRGFSYRQLGELDEAGNSIGGTRLATLSLELDSLFIETKFGRFGAATFFDAGNAGLSFSPFRHRGAGVGLRWLSPIGMVRADIGVAISEPGRPKRLHLTIGPDL